MVHLVTTRDLFYGNFKPDLPHCRHVAGAAVVLRSGVGPEGGGGGGGGGAAGRAAAEPAEGGADRGFVVEDEHWPAVGSQGVVHVVDCAQQNTAGQARLQIREQSLKSLRLVLTLETRNYFYFSFSSRKYL